MKPKLIKVGKFAVRIDSAQYRAILRTRYRKFLLRKGVPSAMIFSCRSLEDLVEAARWVTKKG